MKTKYTGTVRTALTKEERNALKANASRQGMTLTGYIDAICRRAIKEESKHGTESSRA